MKRLIEYTKILRSKNAGPLYITFDLIFDSVETLQYVKDNLTTVAVAKAYNIDESAVSIISFEKANSLKITFPRKTVSGAIDDVDIYGCQQHMPLADLMV